jgi:two-component system sensor histidine kinase TctE
MPDEGTPPQRAHPRSSFAPLQRTAPASKAEQASASVYQNPLRAEFEQRSLFGEILDWMLAPLLLLWPMSVTITYLVAQTISNAPFDRNLADAVSVLADHLKESGRVTLQLPMTAREVLRGDSRDSVYYMVLGLRGEFVAAMPTCRCRPKTRCQARTR